MPNITVSVQASKDLFTTLDDQTYTKVLTKSVRDTANYSENQLGVNLQKMVYADKIGDSYVFTGRLLKGRKARQVSPLEIQIESNPMIAGASVNYAAVVNDGYKFMRGRPFFDQTVSDTQIESQKILQNNLNKTINGQSNTGA